MSGAAFALALGAALLHAGWNALLAGSRDSVVAMGALLAFGAMMLAPAALIGGGVSGAAAPYVAASAALELVYFVLLARAYRGGELGVVYPVARGSAPLVVLVLGIVGLGRGVSVLAALGVVLVALGVFLLVRPPEVRRVSVAGRQELVELLSRDVLVGLAIGLTIAGYTLVDSEGVQHADPLAYLFLVTAPCAVAYCGALVAGGHGAALRSHLGGRNALAAAATFGAYAMVLAALERAPAASVAAVRESSVTIAALFAWLFLGEPRRLAPAALVAAGVGAIAYS